MHASELLERMDSARVNVAAELVGYPHRGGPSSGGPSVEQYAGGYLQALNDIDALLNGQYPTDPRSYWSNDGQTRMGNET